MNTENNVKINILAVFINMQEHQSFKKIFLGKYQIKITLN